MLVRADIVEEQPPRARAVRDDVLVVAHGADAAVRLGGDDVATQLIALAGVDERDVTLGGHRVYSSTLAVC